MAVLISTSVCITGTTLFVASPGARGRGVRAMHGRRPQVLAIAELRAMLAPIFLNGLAIGAISVGLPALALHAGSRPASGVLLAVWSLGSVTGGLWYGARSWRAPLRRRYPLLLLSGVVCTAPLIVARTIPEGIVGALVAGLTLAPVFSCQYALVGRAVPDGVETEAFTWVSSALIGGLAAEQLLEAPRWRQPASALRSPSAARRWRSPGSPPWDGAGTSSASPPEPDRPEPGRCGGPAAGA